MPNADRLSQIAAPARSELATITRLAHVNTFHPNAFDWTAAAAPEELAYLSKVAFGAEGHEAAAIAYFTKELAQLAEIERHVSAVMALVLGELHDLQDPVNLGTELHHAVSCFAAEEIQHANTFYRYVREISGIEPRIEAALFTRRLAIFQGEDHPYVKLVALCCSAYVGESVITVFEHRVDALDADRARFFTRLLHTHGLDEARHVKIDHVAMKLLYSTFAPQERDRTIAMLHAIEELNRELGAAFAAVVRDALDVDYVAGNVAAAVQAEITSRFSELIIDSDGTLRTVDEVLDDALAGVIEDFSATRGVHRAERSTSLHVPVA